MPLTVPGLSAAIETELATKFPTAAGSTATQERQDFCDTLANAIVTYLLANNLVNVTTAVGPGVGTFE